MSELKFTRLAFFFLSFFLLSLVVGFDFLGSRKSNTFYHTLQGENPILRHAHLYYLAISVETPVS